MKKTLILMTSTIFLGAGLITNLVQATDKNTEKLSIEDAITTV